MNLKFVLIPMAFFAIGLGCGLWIDFPSSDLGPVQPVAVLEKHSLDMDKCPELYRQTPPTPSPVQGACIEQASGKGPSSSEPLLVERASEKPVSSAGQDSDAERTGNIQDAIMSLIKNNLESFENEAIDEEWAYRMKSEIENFIYTHKEFGYIELEHVICRSSSCEVVGKEVKDEALARITTDIMKESWSGFNQVHFDSAFDENEEGLKRMFLTNP